MMESKSSKDIQMGLPENSKHYSPPINESESPKVNKTRRRGRPKGPYITLNPNIRSILFQILYEQAQIWYDINFADIKDTLRRIREQQLISSRRFSQSFVKEEEGSQSFVKEEEGEKDLVEEKETFSESHAERFTSPSDRFAVFLKTLLFDDPIKIEETSESEYEDANCYSRSRIDEFLELKIGEMFMPTEDLPPVIKDEASGEEKINKGAKRISSIPIKPLEIPLTIQMRDIAKYLKHNEETIFQQNFQESEEKISIIQAISDKTGVHLKTLKRIAAAGPQRKKGGGRRRLDPEMERKLTLYIVELNIRGRPPTRREAQELGQLLSTVPDFRASKGWLDKYSKRAQEDIKDQPFLKEHFKFLTFPKFSEVERKMPIFMCLEKIGAPNKFLKEFKARKTKKWEKYFSESENECESEEEPEPMKRLCQNN